MEGRNFALGPTFMTSRSSGSFRLDYVIYSFIAGPVGIVVFCAFLFPSSFREIISFWSFLNILTTKSITYKRISLL